MPTETPTPSPTPFVWATPTLMPAPDSPEHAIDIPFTGDGSFFITLAESGVGQWQNLNRDGAVDNAMSILIIVLLVFALRQIIRKVRTV